MTFWELYEYSLTLTFLIFFLAIGAIVVLSIFLRQRGSPESKPVDSPNSDTGGG